MTIKIRLDDARRAWEARDPELTGLVVALAERPEEKPESPIREGAPTFAKFLAEIRSKAFRRKPRAEQEHARVELIRALESSDAEVPLPDRLRLHEILTALWEDGGPFARTCLLEIIARVKLTYGPWRALKRIFKEAEARGDLEIFGALAARFDRALAGTDHQVSAETLGYLVRRGWRLLRRTAVALPASYADAASEVLAHYPESTNWDRTWIVNHVFYHDFRQDKRKLYTRSQFTLYRRPDSLQKYRAFGDLWKRSPRPLFALLERAQSDRVREFAAGALKADFRASLRDVEPAWVVRLIHVGSRANDEFAVWVLNNVPRFEQGTFRTLGLHEAVLKLFDSQALEAQSYAAEYARTHARDLLVDELIRLADSGNPAVRKLAADLLSGRDPRKDVGLEAWGRLLETRHGYDLAAAVLRKHFGAKELTPEWFKGRLFSPGRAFAFARETLPQIHPSQSLGAGYFRDLIDSIDANTPAARNVAGFALAELARFDLNALDADFLRRLLIHPSTTDQARAWIDEGRLKAQAIGADFLKVVAFHPAWDADPWVAALKAGGKPWEKGLEFREDLADKALEWLRDVRRFTPAALGFDWLMQLAVRAEPRYHDFAVEVMIKGFVPADFAPKQPAAAEAGPQAAPSTADLGGATFLFTGKLATMQRKEAEDKVKQANGVNSSTVNAKLHYLVIGDEGSPLYGQGKKGSKQVKAEEVNAAGGTIKIISETAFLKMLSGQVQEVSADATLAGSERLWAMTTAPGAADLPLARFAMRYIKRHHPDIALAETDRPVDPGAEIPQAFLTFDRVRPLFAESRKPLRDFALGLARWEFARWAPSIEDLIDLAELPHADVRRFVAESLLAEDTPEHRRRRIDPATLTAAAVYSFCESADEATRELGMELIRRSPRLQLPEELFRLTESPDRRVRGFVVRSLWSLYRDRGITADWKPAPPPQPALGAKAKKEAATALAELGSGTPRRPDRPPADARSLSWLLRRMLFEVPPARLEPQKEEEKGGTPRAKPLPARKAKLALVEVLRDLAIEDAAFARVVLPPLREFMGSRGKSERDACLVAVTRVQHVHPELRPVLDGIGRSQVRGVAR